MSEEKQQIPGSETVCEAMSCEHNDCPICLIHTEERPIRIVGLTGCCENFKFSMQKMQIWLAKNER